MYKSKEIKGLSYLSIYLDIISFLCSSLYPFHKGYSFITYGENKIILLEILFTFLWHGIMILINHQIDKICLFI